MHDSETVPALEPDAIFEAAPRFIPQARFRVRPAKGRLGSALLLGLAIERPQQPGEVVPRIIWRRI